MFLLKTGCYFSTGTSPPPGPNVAVVLSGCGVFDGSEIHEASACLVHLSRGGANVKIYAPDIEQMHVVNHALGIPSPHDVREVLVESARIARGKIHGLQNLKASEHDAVVFPGGFGVAKNLSDFANTGALCKLNIEVEKVLKDFHSSKKPMGLCCIAPILAARVIPKVEITMGMEEDDGSGRWPYAGSTDVVKGWGAVHHNREVNDIVVDKKNLVVTTPAFMYETPRFHEVFDGIGKMIKAILELIKKR